LFWSEDRVVTAPPSEESVRMLSREVLPTSFHATAGDLSRATVVGRAVPTGAVKKRALPTLRVAASFVDMILLKENPG
jgi:hypothetical protein